MSIVYANARLTKVTDAGAGDAYDADPAAGPERWAGDLGVTFRDRHLQVIVPGRLSQVDQAHLVVPYDVGSQIEQGDVLTFTFEGATHSRKAGTIIRAALTGRVRVDLENT